MEINIAVLAELNLEARFVAFYYFLLFELRYIFARIVPNFLSDKHSITMNIIFSTMLLKCLED